MTSPGGPTVGRVSIRVVPDTSGFADDLRKKLKKLQKTESVTIPVKFKADQENLKTELEKLRVRAIQVPVEPDLTGFSRELNNRVKAVKPTPVKVPAEPNLTGFRTQLNNAIRAVKPTAVKVPVEPDLTRFRTALRTQLAATNQNLQVPVELNPNITAFRARLRGITGTVSVDLTPNIAALRTLLRGIPSANVPVDLVPNITAFRARLRGITGTVRVDLNPNITDFRARLRALSGTVNINVDVNEALIAARIAAAIQAGAALGSLGLGGGIGGGGIGGGGFLRVAGFLAQIVGYLLLATVLSAALIVAGAAIAAAWGFISTAIVGLPALILGLIPPIAAVALGMDGIKKAAKTLQPEFDRLKKAVSDTFEKGFTEAFKIIKPIFPLIQGGMVGTAQAINFVVVELSKFLLEAAKVKEVGSEISLLETVFNRISGAIIAMSPAINDLVFSFLKIASLKELWDGITGAIQRFAASFKTMVSETIADGTMQEAFKGLGVVVGALGDAFVGLVRNGLELFSAAWPGVAHFLDALTGFFDRFNWKALGESVSGVFNGLATALENVPDGTFRKIEDGFKKFSDTINSPEFQKGLSDFIASIPDALALIDKLAKGFGPLATEVGGAITTLNDIATSAENALKKVKEFSDWIDTQLFGEPLEVPEAWKSPLEKWIDGWLGTGSTGEAERKAEEAGKRLAEAYERGVGKGPIGRFGPMEGSLETLDVPSLDEFEFDLEFPDLEELAKDALEGIEKAIDDAEPKITSALDAALEGLGTSAENGMLNVQNAISSGTTGWALAIGVGMQQVMLRFGQSFSQMETIGTQGMIRVQTAMTNGTTGWSLAIGVAMQAVLLVLQTAYTQMATVATQGMIDVQAAMALGAVNWPLEVDLAMQRIQLVLQAGFAALAAITSLGMQTVTNTITLGANAWELAVIVAVQRMLAALRAGFVQMLAIVTEGMRAIGAVIAASLSLIVMNVENVILLLQTMVREGLAVIVVLVTEAMDLLLVQFGRWVEIVTLIADAILLIVTAVEAFMTLLALTFQVGMDLLNSITGTAWDAILEYFRASIAEMERLTSDLWRFLVDAATSGAAAMTTAIRSGMTASVAAVRSGVDSMVSTLNAAVPKFRAAGSNMGAALAAGLRSQLAAVRSAAAALANAAAAATSSAARMASPSRVFIHLGKLIGVGFAMGMESQESRVARAAENLVTEVENHLKNVAATAQDLSGQIEFTPTVSDAKALASANLTPATTTGGLEITNNIYNPTPETGSDSVAKTARRQARLGLFG